MPTLTEKELTRNFCPRCMVINKVRNCILYCLKCGNTDLIPEPKEYISFTEEESDLIIGAIPLQSLPNEEQKPKIEIDPLVVDQLKQPFAFISGSAGTGKSTIVRLMSENDPNYIELTATSGIAAVNLGGRTINSVLKYFNTKSLETNYQNGKLQWGLRNIRAKGKRVLGIEEVSMLDSQQLDIICAAVDEINNDRSGRELGIHLCGDFSQLPPVNAEFCFKSSYWERFEKNTILLKKIWRQDNPDFIKAMNFARSGNGNSCVTQLINCGVKFVDKANNNFDGTTLISLNIGVDAFNDQRLKQLTTPMIRTMPKKQGLQLKEWEKLIPTELRFKIGAYVMILSNDIPNFNYVNGDAGYIKSYDKLTDKFEVELVRNGKIVKISRIMRENLSDKAPTNSNFTNGFTPYLSRNSPGDWIVGNIFYHPLRLAWASSIHKCLHDEAIVKELNRGYIPIKYIRERDSIWNGQKFVRVIAVNKSNQLGLEISTGSAKTISSFDHRFPTSWFDHCRPMQAKDFKIGQELLDGSRVISGGILTIQELKSVGSVAMVDLELEDTKDFMSHLFWADGFITHNSQGLSLDRVQIDTRANFCSFPSMLYVAISRARTAEGLVLIGNPAEIAKKIKTSNEVKRWI